LTLNASAQHHLPSKNWRSAPPCHRSAPWSQNAPKSIEVIGTQRYLANAQHISICKSWSSTVPL